MEDPLTKKPDKISYETLWKSIIRPERDVYTEKDLGPKIFRFNKVIYSRTDYDILDFQGNILKLSIIEPDPDNRPSDIMPIVLYLHENSGSRVQGLDMKLHLLKRNINICSFDFAGSGQSEGKYISLGYHEKKQVKNVVDFLERLPGVGNIGIWGRSMGAATTLLYTPTDKRIKCIVVDSPFSDFRKLAKEICQSNVTVPGLLIEGAISIIGSTVYSKNGMDVNDIKPINTVKNCHVPVIFIHAEDDTFVKYKHSEKIFQNYAGSIKMLKGVTGGHNGNRPTKLLEEVGEFFADYLIPGYMNGKLIKGQKNFEKIRRKSSEKIIIDNNNINEINEKDDKNDNENYKDIKINNESNNKKEDNKIKNDSINKKEDNK